VDKLKKLKGLLKDMGSAVVAYSGGVDSTFLLKVAGVVLGKKVLAVTAVSESFTSPELKLAKTLAKEMGVKHRLIRTAELADPRYRSNPPDRCYHCKKTLFRRLNQIAQAGGYRHVLEASNADDLKDFRPGRRAVEEAGAKTPLVEAGLTKREIRALSKRLHLRTWDLPSQACLASRIPYNTPITAARLRRIAAAEAVLHAAGFKQCRVRDHGDIARIEVEASALKKLIRPRTALLISEKFKKLSYKYVALDLQGYRLGSLNEALPGRAASV
jgi:pyridinium-3,5-biscarboxylic acid mononucleotide sulfurtransferase